MNNQLFFQDNIPDKIIECYKKISDRKLAESLNWKTPGYYIIKINLIKGKSFIKKKTEALLNLNEKFTDSIHILLLEPQTIHGKVQRIFSDKENFISNLNNFIEEVSNEVKSNQDIIILITDVVNASMSGMAKYDNTYIHIEAAFGQMIGKGLSNTSTYTFKNKKLEYKSENIQKGKIRIIKGIPTQKSVGKQITVSDDILNQLTSKVNGNVPEFRNKIVEWFIDDSNQLYFYDLMHDSEIISKDSLRISDIYLITSKEKVIPENPRIIYPGKFKGHIKQVKGLNKSKSIDKHFEENLDYRYKGKLYIYCCSTPSLEFRDFLHSAGGFIFKEGGQLSHLATLIRNQKIPAIIDENLFSNALEGEVTLSCGNPLLKRNKENREKINQLILFSESLPLNFSKICVEDCKDIRNYGGKSLYLNFMKELGLKIPNTLLICSHTFASREIDEIMKKINNFFFNEENVYPIAIRSSAMFEDIKEFSTAGKYISKLDINTPHAIQNVLKEIKNDFNKKGESKFSLIAQKQIKPLYGGVLFTSSPLDYESDEILINLSKQSSTRTTQGLGDQIEIVINKNELKQSLNKQLEKFNLLNLHITIEKLLKKSIKLEKKAGTALDIEFVIDIDRECWFLQSRPILFE